MQYNLAVHQQAKPKRVAAKPESQSADPAHEILDGLVEQFNKLEAELKDSASQVDAFKKKDLGISVRQSQVVHKARSGKRKTYIDFCKRVGLKGARKRRYAKMGEHADRLLEVIDLIKNESVAYEIARLAKSDWEKLKTSGSLTKEMTKRELEEFLEHKRPVRSIFTLHLPKQHSIHVKELCGKLAAVVEEFPDVPRKGTGEFEQFNRSA